MEVFDIAFYTFCGPILLRAIYRSDIPLLSFTGIYLRMVLFLLYIPAYFIYRGGILYTDSSDILSFVYFALLFQIVASAAIGRSAWNAKQKFRLIYVMRKSSHLFFWILLASVSAYSLSYFFIYYEKIPLFQIFHGDFIQAATTRAELTHDVGEETGIFSFYRPITKDLIFLLFSPLIIREGGSRLVKLVLFVLLSTTLMAHAEKSYAVMLVLLIFSARYLMMPENKKVEAILGASVAVLVLAATYLLFAEDFAGAVQYIPYRLMLQTGYVPVQLAVAEPYGPLYLSGINLGFFGRLLDIQHVDISKLAWAAVHGDFEVTGLSGSSAGLGSADAYMILGVFGFFLYPLILYFHFFLDRLLRTAAVDKQNEHDAYSLGRVLYIYLISLYPIFLVSSFLGLFSFPYLFQPGLLLSSVVVLIFYRVKIDRF